MIEHLEGNFPLAQTPGFHALDRAVFDGVLERGGIVLKIFCSCNKSEAIARIEARPAKTPNAFMYWQVAKTELQPSPALDARTGAGHFVTDEIWECKPEGMPPALAPKLAQYRRARVKNKPLAVAPEGVKPAKKSTREEILAAMGCPRGVCPHELGFHDEKNCSKCGGPCSAKKAPRARSH